MKNQPMMTPEEKATLQEEVVKAVQDQLSVDAEMTKTEAIDSVINALEAMKEQPEFGGMGEEAEQGMKMPGEGEENSDEE